MAEAFGVAGDSQDRPQRCARAGALGSHRLLQARACEVAVGSRSPLADHRAQEAGEPAVTLENQIRGLAIVFGIRLPRALSAAFINQALKASEGVAGLSAAMRGLIAARTVITAVAAIDADMRRMARASVACRRLMTIPGVGQLTALAFVAAIDDPSRIRRSRDIGAYLGLVRHQSGLVRPGLEFSARARFRSSASRPAPQKWRPESTVLSESPCAASHPSMVLC
jgi:hypothetical protein